MFNSMLHHLKSFRFAVNKKQHFKDYLKQQNRLKQQQAAQENNRLKLQKHSKQRLLWLQFIPTIPMCAIPLLTALQPCSTTFVVSSSILQTYASTLIIYNTDQSKVKLCYMIPSIATISLLTIIPVDLNIFSPFVLAMITYALPFYDKEQVQSNQEVQEHIQSSYRNLLHIKFTLLSIFIILGIARIVQYYSLYFQSKKLDKLQAENKAYYNLQ